MYMEAYVCFVKHCTHTGAHLASLDGTSAAICAPIAVLCLQRPPKLCGCRCLTPLRGVSMAASGPQVGGNRSRVSVTGGHRWPVGVRLPLYNIWYPSKR